MDSDQAVLEGILSLTADSRQVRPGSLFAALRGEVADGRDFIEQAVADGAKVILTDALEPARLAAIEARARVVLDPNPRRRLAEMAVAFYGSQTRYNALVTGTNGKTSTVDFIRQIWEAAGWQAACIGTLGVTLASGRIGAGLTTPDPVALARQLSQLANGGVQHVAVEASSHGLAQDRLSGIKASAGAFTSFSRDHLDYHKTERAYLEAKLKLFRERLPAGAAAVIYADGEFSAEAIRVAKRRGLSLWTYGAKGDRLRLLSRTEEPAAGGGQRLALRVDGERAEVLLPLVGDFQAENALAALGIALASGVERATALAALERLQPVVGRLQFAGRMANGAAAYVDYAHTPAALQAALAALRPSVAGRLWVIFGAGGERDRGKRPIMGRVAASLADAVVVTDDNPRGENPADIRAEILAAAEGAHEIGDRRSAIRTVAQSMGPGDVMLIAGKGHETGQTVAGKTVPFDDMAEAKAALAEAERG